MIPIIYGFLSSQSHIQLLCTYVLQYTARALHAGVKVFHPHKLGALGVLPDLSYSEFVHEDIEEMESVMLEVACS